MTLSKLKFNDIGAWLLGLIMVLVPIQYLYNNEFGVSSLRITQAQSFELSALVLFALFILQNVYLGLFLLWAIFQYAFWGFAGPVGAELLVILSGCMIYQGTYALVDEENVDLVFNFMIFFALLNMYYMIAQGFGWELLYQEFSSLGTYQSQLLGFMGLKAISGMLMAMAIPFFAFRYPTLAWGLFIPIYASECSSAMVAAIVAYLWQIWHISRKWFIILTAFLVVGGSIYAINDSKAGMFADRVSMWKVAMRDAVTKPIMGFGPDSFRCITKDKQFMYWKNVRTGETGRVDIRDTIEYQNTGKYNISKYPFLKEGDTTDGWDNPHNEFIQLFYEFGIVAVLILGFFIWDIRRRFNKQIHHMIPLVGFFMGVMIMSIGQFPFHLARVGLFIPIFLGCYYKLSDLYNKADEEYLSWR